MLFSRGKTQVFCVLKTKNKNRQQNAKQKKTKQNPQK